MSQGIPDNQFDWVKSRATCSPASLFNALKTALLQDVESIKRHVQNLQLDSRLRFSIRTDRDAVIVTREDGYPGSGSSRETSFKLESGKIMVRPANGLPFSGSPMFDEDGECRLLVRSENGEQCRLKIWQFCQRALDDLFFGSAPN